MICAVGALAVASVLPGRNTKTPTVSVATVFSSESAAISFMASVPAGFTAASGVGVCAGEGRAANPADAGVAEAPLFFTTARATSTPAMSEVAPN